MATTNPPDLWNASVGIWGTNFDQDVSFFLTGPASVKFTSALLGATPTLASDRIPFAAGDRIYGEAWVAADSTTVAHGVGLWVGWFNAADSLIASVGFTTGACAVANTWEKRSNILTAPALTAYARFYMVKADFAFNAWFDSVLFTHAIQNQHVDAAAAIVGSKLKEGSGPLSKLSSSGFLDNLTSVSTRYLDDVTDGPITYRKVGGVSVANQITGTSIAAQAVSNSHISNTAAIVGTKLSAGAGVLSHLDNTTGVLDNLTSITTRSLDNITDGSTYARPLAAALSSGKVNLGAGTAGLANQLPNAQLGAAAVQTANIAAAAVTAHVTNANEIRTALNQNANFVMRTRG